MDTSDTVPMALAALSTAVIEGREARVTAIQRLRLARENGRALRPLVAITARALGVSPRTIWRWLAHGVPESPASSAWEPSEDDVTAYVRWTGNAAGAWRERRAVSPGTPQLRTFQAAITRALTPGDRATVREGEAGRRRHQVYLRWEPDARNERWETDHKRLDVAVLFPRAHRPRQPWLTSFQDAYSRAVMGWAIADHPSSATVLAAFGEAIRVDAQHGPFGGLPAALRPDRGLEFAAQVLERACGVLTVVLLPTPPYTPHAKGKIERFHETIIDQLLRELPHFTGGPRDAAGRLWADGLPVLGFADFVTRFDRWARWYNEERPHEALDGQTPMQRWLEDATPLRLVAESELHWTLLGEERRRVVTSGIRFNGLHFIAPELNGLVGDDVQIRFRPHDNTQIEVFRNGNHLCTARPQNTLTFEERKAILVRRRADAREQHRRQRRAARQVRERFTPATAHAASADVTVITSDSARRFVGGRDDREMRRIARIDLLHLEDHPR